MILKGNQRGGGQQLAVHLMNRFDNENVELAEVRGSVAQDLSGAFTEIEADASATKATKPFYHLSASPDPSQRQLTREEYLDLLERTERSLKLVGQPRAVVFHVKDGREHVHAVWSRIQTDQEQVKAVHISHDRLKLRTVAREFARDYGLELPDGLKKDGKRDRFNDRAKQEDLGERQQKERNGISKAQRMADIATCWKETGNGAAFVQALESKGYFLARGDQRTFVVVDLHGEVHSLSRQLSGVAKSKDLNDRLAGLPLDKLDDIAGAKERARKEVEKVREQERQQVSREKDDQREKKAEERFEQLKKWWWDYLLKREQENAAMIARHMAERAALKQVHQAFITGVASDRLARQPKGLMAFLTRITGIQKFTEARQRRADQRTDHLHKQQQDALARRHDRELQEMARRRDALESQQAREKRSATVAIERAKFERIAALVRKPPGRELKPEFDRVAPPQVLQRTGTEDAKAPEQKGKLVNLFTRFKEALHPPEPKPAPAPARPEFEKAAKPPIDLVEAFNREVENRRSREDRDRDPDGPDRDFDPTKR